jgi:glycosyltransferase involved in cell wall biosynthesis
VKVLFFASDFKIGLSSILTDKILAYSKIDGLKIIGVRGENEQEEYLTAVLEKEKIKVYIIQGLDEHNDFFKLLRNLRNIIKEEDPEIIHIQNNWQLALTGLIRYSNFPHFNYKIIYTIHGFRNHEHFLKSFLSRILIGIGLLFFSDSIIYMSDFVLKKFHLLKYKMTKIHYGVNDKFFDTSCNSIEICKIKMIFPAQFREGKHQDLLIRAFARYCCEKGDKESELWLPGDGKNKTKCQDLAKNLGILKQVFFPGFVSKREIIGLVKNCNIGVIPSSSETFGQCIVEPFVSGRCIITRKVGIASEIITDGINGFFFETEDELTSIILKISENPEIIRLMGDKNFENRKLFSWENSKNEYELLIRKLASLH